MCGKKIDANDLIPDYRPQKILSFEEALPFMQALCDGANSQRPATR